MSDRILCDRVSTVRINGDRGWLPRQCVCTSVPAGGEMFLLTTPSIKPLIRGVNAHSSHRFGLSTRIAPALTHRLAFAPGCVLRLCLLNFKAVIFPSHKLYSRLLAHDKRNKQWPTFIPALGMSEFGCFVHPGAGQADARRTSIRRSRKTWGTEVPGNRRKVGRLVERSPGVFDHRPYASRFDRVV